MKRGVVQAIECALDLRDIGKAEDLLRIVQRAMPGEVTPFLRAHATRLAARMAALRGEAENVDPGFLAAEQGFQHLGVPFDLAVSLLERAEWLVTQGRAAEAGQLIDQARDIFESLQAKTWLERLARVSGMEGVPA